MTHCIDTISYLKNWILWQTYEKDHAHTDDGHLFDNFGALRLRVKGKGAWKYHLDLKPAFCVLSEHIQVYGSEY